MIRRTKRIKGFTLVELLVVVAIVCIFVALLYPAVKYCRTKAKENQQRSIQTELLNKPKITYDKSGNTTIETVKHGNCSYILARQPLRDGGVSIVHDANCEYCKNAAKVQAAQTAEKE